jgi:phenylacetate-CoA ligase
MDATSALIRNVVFPAWVFKNRSRRLEYLAELERTQFLSLSELRDLQSAHLQAVLQHAYVNCPFYRRRFDQSGVYPLGIRSVGDLASIPLTSKTDLQQFTDEMISRDFSRSALLRDATGGSTGSPVVFYYDRDRLDSRVAATMRHDRWAGWDIGEKLAVLWGAPTDVAGATRDRLRAAVLGRRLLLDASAIDDDRMARFAERLRAYQPKVILAYANTMTLFARFVQNTGFSGIRPEGIICSAEVLTDEGRSLIENTFACPVFNRYGSREFAVIASECEAHAGLHINAENLLVEVLVRGVPAVDEDGEIVVTDLRNRAMPLIRYRTGDVGRLLSAPCPCGRGLPLMVIAGGRTTDFLTTEDGSKISGIVVATYVITEIPGIRQVQFVQDRREHLTVNLVRGPGWSAETMRLLVDRIRTFFGQATTVDVVFQSDIPAEPSGKYRFSISRLPQ